MALDRETLKEDMERMTKRVDAILALSPEGRHEAFMTLIRQLPPPVASAIVVFAAALGLAAAGTCHTFPELKAVLDKMSEPTPDGAEPEGQRYAQELSDVMGLAIMVCSHGVALEVDEKAIAAEIGQGQAVSTKRRGFAVDGTSDELGVPWGTKFDGGPDGKGH